MGRASASTRARLLSVALTDSTFERVEVHGAPAWEGRCLHCNRKLLLSADGTPLNGATLEHIVPTTAGGTEDALNLGLACARCNHLKGARHDGDFKRSARAREVVDKLLEKRRTRWRDEPAR